MELPAFTTRQSLVSTCFEVEEAWAGVDPETFGASARPGLFVRLIPPVAELDSFYTAVGLRIQFAGAEPVEYSAGTRDAEGCLVLFFSNRSDALLKGTPAMLVEPPSPEAPS